MAVCTFDRKPALMFIEKMLAALAVKPMVRAEMEKELFASKSKITQYVKYLHSSDGKPKQIYICRYDILETGGKMPRWAAGNHQDAKPPKRRTSADRWAQLKADKDRHTRRKAVQRAKAVAAQTRIKPQGIFAALGL